MLTLSYHDVDSRLISVHRVEYNLRMTSRLTWMLLQFFGAIPIRKS